MVPVEPLPELGPVTAGVSIKQGELLLQAILLLKKQEYKKINRHEGLQIKKIFYKKKIKGRILTKIWQKVLSKITNEHKPTDSRPTWRGSMSVDQQETLGNLSL